MNAARFGGFRKRWFVADAVRYRQRDLMAQNAWWNLKKTVLVLLTMPMLRVK